MVVAVVAYYIPRRDADLKTVAWIGLIAALTFALLDFFSPSIGASSRLGAGFGIGSNLVGFGHGTPYTSSVPTTTNPYTGSSTTNIIPSLQSPLLLEPYSNPDSFPQYVNVQTTETVPVTQTTETVPAFDAVGNEFLVRTPVNHQTIDGIHSVYANPIDGFPLGTRNELTASLTETTAQ